MFPKIMDQETPHFVPKSVDIENDGLEDIKLALSSQDEVIDLKWLANGLNKLASRAYSVDQDKTIGVESMSSERL